MTIDTAAIRARHQRLETEFDGARCDYCYGAWPCDAAQSLDEIDRQTIQAIDEIDRLTAEITRLRALNADLLKTVYTGGTTMTIDKTLGFDLDAFRMHYRAWRKTSLDNAIRFEHFNCLWEPLTLSHRMGKPRGIILHSERCERQ